MTKRTLWQILDAVSIATVILMVVLFISCLSGCGPSIRIDPKPIDQQLHEAVADRVEAENKTDEAIKTSADARAASLRAAAEVRTMKRLLAEKEAEVVRLDEEAIRLQNAEIAHRIVIASWSLAGIGLLVAIVGAFLWLRFQSKTAGIAALCGVGCIGLGVVGLWLAPHWLLVAWSFGAVLLTAMVGGLVWLLVHRDASATHLAGEFKRYASALPDDLRAKLDGESIQGQAAGVKAHIDEWLKRAPVQRVADAASPVPPVVPEIMPNQTAVTTPV